MLVWCFVGMAVRTTSVYGASRVRSLLVQKSRMPGAGSIVGRASSLIQSTVMGCLSEYHVAFSNQNVPLFDQNVLLWLQGQYYVDFPFSHFFYTQKRRKWWMELTQMCCCLSSVMDNFVRTIKFPWNLCLSLLGRC